MPELNLSPRDESLDMDADQIKNNQRKLFENIQAQYVNNNGSLALSNKGSNHKRHSTKVEDK